MAKTEMKVLCATAAGALFSKAVKISQLQETVLRRVYDVGLMTQVNRRSEWRAGFVVRLMASRVK